MFLRAFDVVSCSTRRLRFMIVKQCFRKSGAEAGHMAKGTCEATLHVFERTMMIEPAIVQSRFSSFVRSTQKTEMYLRVAEKKKHQASNIIMI
jgi:hypothetical protein